jgi:hypothetical protein
MEQPEALADEIRAFFRSLRAGQDFGRQAR